MVFTVSNQANIANKYIRFAKWKIRKLSRKYGEILYSEIYINKASASPTVYNATIKLGVPGPDIVIKASSMDLKQLWSQISMKTKRQMRKLSAKK